MALVNYLKDITDENIGFLVSKSTLRDYFINVVPILTGKNALEYNENIGFLNTVNLLVTDNTNTVFLNRLRKDYSILLFGGFKNVKGARQITDNIAILDKGVLDEKVEIEIDEEGDLLDLFEGEKLYNRLFGLKIVEKKVIEKKIPREIILLSS